MRILTKIRFSKCEFLNKLRIFALARAYSNLLNYLNGSALLGILTAEEGSDEIHYCQSNVIFQHRVGMFSIMSGI